MKIFFRLVVTAPDANGSRKKLFFFRLLTKAT
jgi:hypothetical protein